MWLEGKCKIDLNKSWFVLQICFQQQGVHKSEPIGWLESEKNLLLLYAIAFS